MKSNKWQYLRRALTLLFFLLFIFYLRSVNFHVFGQELSAHVLSLPGLILISFMSYYLATWAWIVLDHSGELQTISFFHLFMIRQSGETLSTINPTGVVGGDLYKTLHLKKYGIHVDQILPAIFSFRVQSIVSFILFFITFSASILMELSNSKWATGFIFVILILACFLVIYILSSKRLMLYLLIKNFSFMDESSKNRIKKFNHSLVEQYTKHKAKTYLATLLLYLHWMIGGLEIYYLISFVFQIPMYLIDAFAAEFGILITKTLGMFVPGQLGVEEFGNKTMLGLIGISSTTLWLTFSVLRRTRQLFWILLSSLYIFVMNSKVEVGIQNGKRKSFLNFILPFFNSSR